MDPATSLLNMKKSILILFFGLVGVVIIFLLRAKLPVSNEPTSSQQIPTNATTVLPVTNTSVEMATQGQSSITTQSEPEKLLDATKAQSIAEWTNAIPNLKLRIHSKYVDSWGDAQASQTHCPNVILTGVNGNTVKYAVDLISIDVIHDQIQRTELHTPRMNIDEAKQLGSQLCNMLQLNPNNFSTWCDKVGNQWVDAPTFSSGNGASTFPDKLIGFSVQPTFNEINPWYIEVVISSKKQ